MDGSRLAQKIEAIQVPITSLTGMDATRRDATRLDPMRDPSVSSATTRALRAVNRGVGMARLSSVVMIILGALSTLLSILNPLSLGFLVSVAVLVVGIIEWRMGQALRALDEKAPGRLGINQTTLGVVIAVYSICKALAFDQATIDDLLNGESAAQLLNLYPPGLVRQVREMLPQLVPLVYYGVGAIALLGCWATALFYRSRLKHVTLLKAMRAVPANELGACPTNTK